MWFFLQCGLINVFSNLPSVKMPCHILSKHEVYIQCGLIHVLSNLPSVKTPCHTLSRCVAFHLSGLIHVVSIFCVNALLHFEQACGFLPVWNNFICFQMCLLCECLVTFKAGMKIFTGVDQFVGFQTTHQGECLGTF